MTTTVDPKDRRVQAIFLKGHLRLMSAGMNTRLPKMEALERAGAITGKKYKRGQYGQAAEDIKEWLSKQQ